MAKFIPPPSGNLPKRGQIILADVYSGCREKNGPKRICAAVAWTEVKKDYRMKKEKWVKL